MPTSIRKRLTYTYIGLALGPVLLLGIIIVWLSYRTQQRHALDLQQQTSKQVAIEVESFIQAREQELRLLEEIQGFNSLDRNLQTNLLMELRAYQGYYEELTLLNIEGQEELASLVVEGFVWSIIKELLFSPKMVFKSSNLINRK